MRRTAHRRLQNRTHSFYSGAKSFLLMKNEFDRAKNGDWQRVFCGACTRFFADPGRLRKRIFQFEARGQLP
jgi:hypothetical protein